MPAIFPTGTSTLATIRNLAQRGDLMATAIMAIMDGTFFPSMTAAAEASDKIRVTGQVRDQDGSLVSSIKSVHVTAFLATTQYAEVAIATAAALPACTPAGTGVGHTLTGNANGALAAIDGVTPVAADRILVKNQAAADDNGVYTLTTLGDGSNPFVLTRATDFDVVGETIYGASFFVRNGRTQNGSTFVHTTTAAITVDTTNLTFTDLDSLLSLALGAAGATIKSKLSARELLLITSSTGEFSLDITGVAATIGDVWLKAVTDNGENEIIKVTFA